MTGLLLVAAGSGQRLGATVPKALVEVAGDTMIGHCLRTVTRVDRLDDVVVVAPAAHATSLTAQMASRFPGVRVVVGGSTRDASVRQGLAALSADTDFVLIHDAARPFVPAEVFERVLDALAQGANAVVPAVPVADTIKVVHEGVVDRTLARDELMAVQTPQGFRRSTLVAAHDHREVAVTDDAMLIEQAGGTVRVVQGSAHSLKITTEFDLRMADVIQTVDRRP